MLWKSDKVARTPEHKVEVCIDLKGSLRKTVKHLFPKVRVATDHFHVIADANRRIVVSIHLKLLE